MLAWNSDFAFVCADIAGTSQLPVGAENQGKLVVTTEMGGGECVPASVHRITQSGLCNVLLHTGALRGREQTRASLGKPPTILAQALNREDSLRAPCLTQQGDCVAVIAQPVNPKTILRERSLHAPAASQ